MTLHVTEPTYLTLDCIREHPNFSSARNTYMNAVLDLYETRRSLIELMLDGGRIMVYGIIMALWGGYQEEDLSTQPTISRLKHIVGWFTVASPRQIDLIIARFAQVGHIEIAPAPHDLRLRIVLPTPALIDHDRNFICAHYSSLGTLIDSITYARPLSGDPAFLRAMRGAWIATLQSMAQNIFIANPSIMRFYAASAGMLMLMRLVRLQEESADGWVAVDYTNFGRRFGVSRTHVRTLFRTIAASGDIEIDQHGLIQVRPALIAALDHNIAGRMSLLDRAHAAAIMRLTAEGETRPNFQCV